MGSIEMNELYRNHGITQLPLTIKSILWQFVRGDMPINDFEQWVYSSKKLELLIKEGSYFELMLLDYKDIGAIHDLKLMIYKLLIQESPTCLCITFPNNTLLYPFTDGIEQHMFLNQVDQIKSILTIDNFSGKSPIHQSRWYQPAKLCKCSKCSQYWLMLFEESEGANYYFIRLNKQEVTVINQNLSWPNERWPSRLKNWKAFLELNFQSWNNLYSKKKHSNNNMYEFLKNYDLRPKYT